MEALMEELTVQQVILDSMDGEFWDGIEKEREETKKEIERLKRLLRQPKQSQAGQNTDANVEGGQVDSRDNQSIPDSFPGGARPRTPTARPDRATNMTTPHKDNDIWSSPSSHSLPTRKRDFSSTNLSRHDGQAKSRRSTPTPSNSHFSTHLPSRPDSTNNEAIDIIDLTGDDVDYDSTVIAQQIRQQQRQEQERRDREMALQLSSQMGTDMAAPSSSDAARNDAFSKLMTTQRLNSRGPSDWEDYETNNDTGNDVPVESIESPRRPMPGAWDDGLRTKSLSPAGSSMHHLESPFARVPNTNGFPQGAGRHSIGSNGTGFGSDSYQRSGSSSALQSVPSNSPFGAGFQRPSPGMPGTYYTPSLPSSGGMPMSNIINMTSMFDYANGFNQNGQPISGRLANFLTDVSEPGGVSEKELDDLLKNIRPDMDIPAKKRESHPPGLKQPLYYHQQLALTWMKEMEQGTNKGGILADDMGLGKTISTLALMLERPATARPKTNLIIGPLSLIRQWEEEIAKKTKLSHRLSVFIYHNRKSTTDELLTHDVVLTTYGTLAQELKRREQFIADNNSRNIDFSDKSCLVKFPLLHPEKAVFHRIILDEAQCIKNRNTQTAKACHRLKATYRWCLTGTPMMNGILELYSLLRFLRIKPYSEWDKFRQGFGVLFGQKGDPKSVAMNRLRATLKAIMLRRKKDSQLDGKPILVLPTKSEHIVYAKLSDDELDFYKQLEEKAQVMFSKYLREGSVGKNYSNILVLLLRLRQACCHPHLNLDVDDANINTPLSDEEMLKLVKTLDLAIVERIKTAESFECPICYDAVQSPLFFIPCGHDSCNDCLTRIADNAVATNLQEGTESDRAKCPVCRGIFEPKKCFSYDVFKQVHMPETVAKTELDLEEECGDSEEEDDGEDDSESEDDFSDDEIDGNGNLKDFVVNDDEDDDDLDDLDNLKRDATLQKHTEMKKQKKNKKKKSKGKGKDKMLDVRPSMLKSLRKEGVKNRKAYKKYMRYLRKTWMPSAKVTECMKLLKQIQGTGEKTIIFSQWTLLLDLLEVAMWHDKFEHKPIRYDGGMTGQQRSDAAKDFRDKSSAKVMLVSLRAGNAGLNLTAASRVIIMDPFWNPYIEMQAVDRTYRIGQQREVQVYRILTQETVEDRIVALQDKKKEIVEAALDETESMKIGRLGVSELKFLFNTRD